MPKLAIIDIGSRSCVMDIYSIKDDRFKQVYHSSSATFLGKNISREGVLDPGSIDKTNETLTDFKKVITAIDKKHAHASDYVPVKIYVFCTQAVRMVKNQQEFLNGVQKILGKSADVQVISGEKEAYYEFLGIINSTAMSEFIMIDIGGSSTEIAIVKDRKLYKCVSLPIGAINNTERFFSTVVVPPHRVSEAINTILLDIENLEWIGEAKNLPIIACGSSARSLAVAEMNNRVATCSSLHGYMINYSNVKFMVSQIAKMSITERVEKLGIKRSSAEVILGGLAPLMALFAATSSRRMYFSEFGVRYGFFYEKFAKMQKMLSPIEPDVLGVSIKRLQARYKCNSERAKLVEELAVSIFEQSQKVHHYGERYKKILSVAALLCDCGEYIQYHNHHQHSYYIIKESDIYALEHNDKFCAAVVAGYHRKDKFHFNRLRYRRIIDGNTLKKLRDLGMIVRIAENIAEREPACKGVKLQIAPQAIQVIIEKKDSIRQEVHYSNSIGKLYGRKVYVI